MGAIGAILTRLPAAVFVVAGLLFGTWFLQGMGMQPNDVARWLSDRVLYDIQLVVVLLPLLAALAALVGIVFMVSHHHTAAMAAGGLVVAFLAIDVLWQVGLGVWITAHLTGRA